MKYLRELPMLRDLYIPRHWILDEEDKEYLRNQEIDVYYSTEGGAHHMERVVLTPAED